MGNSETAASQLLEAISIVRRARLPLAAWRVYATAADLYESLSDEARAVKWRRRSQQIIRSLKNSLKPGDPLRSAAFFSRAENGRPIVETAGILHSNRG
jgi:hypothetical protein